MDGRTSVVDLLPASSELSGMLGEKYTCIVLSSISYWSIDLVWINRMHNK
jgi:hypothetical protein